MLLSFPHDHLLNTCHESGACSTVMELNNLDADVVSIQWGAGGNQVPTLMAMPQRQGPVEACLKCPGSTEDGANTCAWQGTQKAFEKRRT